MLLLIIGFIVLAVSLVVFLVVRRRRRYRQSLENRGIVCSCPYGHAMAASRAWKRHRLRGGDVLTCLTCGHTSIWNLDITPPALVDVLG